MDIIQHARSMFAEDLLALLLNKEKPSQERAEAAIALAGVPEDDQTLYRRQEIVKVNDKTVFSGIESYLDHQDTRLQRWAVRALVWMSAHYRPGPALIPTLAQLLDVDDREYRYDLVALLGRSQQPDAVPVLKRLLKEDTPAISNRVFLALGENQQPTAIDILLKHCRKDAAWRALASIPDERAVQAAFEIARAKPHNDVWGKLILSAQAIDRQDIVQACRKAIDDINSSYPPR